MVRKNLAAKLGRGNADLNFNPNYGTMALAHLMQRTSPQFRELTKNLSQPVQSFGEKMLSDKFVRLANLAALARTFLFPGKKASLVLVKPRSQELNEMRQLIEAGKVRSIISQSYSFSEIAQAHAASETGKTRGKIVLIPDV